MPGSAGGHRHTFSYLNIPIIYIVYTLYWAIGQTVVIFRCWIYRFTIKSEVNSYLKCQKISSKRENWFLYPVGYRIWKMVDSIHCIKVQDIIENKGKLDIFFKWQWYLLEWQSAWTQWYALLEPTPDQCNIYHISIPGLETFKWI